MDFATTPKKTILLIDDDINIRLVIKKLLYSTLINAKIFTSDKGPEGLGLAYILKPDILVLDITLPKYSGREVIDYIVTNNIFLNTKVIILHEDAEISHSYNLGPNYNNLSKKSGDFPESLIRAIEQSVEHKNEDRHFRFSLNIGKTVIFFANSSDTSVRDLEVIGGVLPKIFNTINFIFSQLFTSLYLTLFLLLVGRKDNEENLDQEHLNSEVYRSIAYPTFILGVIVIVVLVIAFIVIILS